MLLTAFQATASIFVLFMTVDFICGLVDLWNASKPQPQPQELFTAPSPAPNQGSFFDLKYHTFHSKNWYFLPL